jgi:hypothetical protein
LNLYYTGAAVAKKHRAQKSESSDTSESDGKYLDLTFRPLSKYNLSDLFICVDDVEMKEAEDNEEDSVEQSEKEEDEESDEEEDEESDEEEDEIVQPPLWTDPNLIKLPEATRFVFDEYVVPLAEYLRGNTDLTLSYPGMVLLNRNFIVLLQVTR